MATSTIGYDNLLTDSTATSVSEARAKGLKHYFTGKPCKYGHIDRRLASNGMCLKCSIRKIRDWAEKNPDDIKKSQQRYRERNHQEIISRGAKYRSTNREAIRLRQIEWQQNNKEKMSEHRKKWRDRNAWMARYYSERYRGRVRLATPIWADDISIRCIYKRASDASKAINEYFEVDHIVPLRSRYVCGLHCEDNLRVIPKKVNRAKSNSYWPGMWS